MKKSLGRRSSSRNPVRTMTFTDFESARKDKKSSIPVRRAHSVERKIGMATPVGKRSCSEDRNSMVTPATSRKTFGTERPSRTTTMSTNSTRLSSFGGARTLRDCRLIEDKDWQLNAQKKIEKFLIEDPEGCGIMSTGSIRPLNLKLFIDVVDLLLRRIINAGEASYINKTNFTTELPYIMKKLSYRGKIEKSWLISVNTPRSWCHALACMDFLVSMISTQMVVDPTSLMYPEISCKEDGEDVWDYKLLLPYVQESFELFTSGVTNYDELQAALDQRFVEMHISNDVYHHINELNEKIQRIEQQCEEYRARIKNEKPALHDLSMTYNNLKEQRAQDENKRRNLADVEEDLKNKVKKKEKECNALRETLLKKQQEKCEIESIVSSQEISPQENEKLKQKRDSLQREIEAEQKYLNTYNELVMKSSMEVLALKKKNAGLIQDFNIAVLNHLSFGLENVPLTGKMDSDDEKTLNAIEKAIVAAKNTLQTASGFCSESSVPKAQQDLELIEQHVIEERNKSNLIIEKLKTSIFEKEEIIKRLKNEEESINKKIIELGSDEMEKELLEERKIRAIKMSEQLDMFRQNSIFYLQKCGEYFSAHEKKMKGLAERYMELEKEYKQ